MYHKKVSVKKLNKLQQAKRGDWIKWMGITSRVLFARTMRGGGVGMGETPDQWYLVLDTGVVLNWDAWSNRNVQYSDAMIRPEVKVK